MQKFRGYLGVFLVSVAWGTVAQGQTIRFQELNRESQGKYMEYVSSSGVSIAVGDSVIMGVPVGPDRFKYAKVSKALDFLFQPAPMEAEYIGKSVFVKEIKVAGNGEGGYTATVTGSCSNSKTIVIEIELAQDGEELRTNQFSREDALAALEREKQKLAQGLITQEEFDRRRAVLMRYV